MAINTAITPVETVARRLQFTMAQQGTDMSRTTQQGIWQKLSDKLKGLGVAESHDPIGSGPDGPGARTPDRLAERMRAQGDIAKRAADRQLAVFLHRHRHWRNASRRS